MWLLIIAETSTFEKWKWKLYDQIIYLKAENVDTSQRNVYNYLYLGSNYPVPCPVLQISFDLILSFCQTDKYSERGRKCIFPHPTCFFYFKKLFVIRIELSALTTLQRTSYPLLFLQKELHATIFLHPYKARCIWY